MVRIFGTLREDLQVHALCELVLTAQYVMQALYVRIHGCCYLPYTRNICSLMLLA